VTSAAEVSADGRWSLTVGLEQLVHAGEQLQQPVAVVRRGGAAQHGEEQHGGLALHPLQGEATRGRRAAVPQLGR